MISLCLTPQIIIVLHHGVISIQLLHADRILTFRNYLTDLTVFIFCCIIHLKLAQYFTW